MRQNINQKVKKKTQNWGLTFPNKFKAILPTSLYCHLQIYFLTKERVVEKKKSCFIHLFPFREKFFDEFIMSEKRNSDTFHI